MKAPKHKSMNARKIFEQGKCLYRFGRIRLKHRE